jgi:hypothetical protein
MTQVVFTLGVIFYIFPFELCSPAARTVLVLVIFMVVIGINPPASFFAYGLKEIHYVDVWKYSARFCGSEAEVYDEAANSWRLATTKTVGSAQVSTTTPRQSIAITDNISI